MPKLPYFFRALFILFLQSFFWSFYPWPNINEETKPLGSWHTVHEPRNKATRVMTCINQETKPLGSWHTAHEQKNKAICFMAYFSSTKKQSHLGHVMLFIHQEKKPLGSWHTVHQPRNKATWVMEYCS